jgi:hypothetical protein
MHEGVNIFSPNVVKAFQSSYRMRETWNIGLIRKSISAFLQRETETQIRWLPSLRGKSLADPFAMVRNERIYILGEEIGYGVSKGRIVCIEALEKRSNVYSFSEPKVALELSCHTSYPYLFEYEGDIYCVPETHQAREVSLYRALAFPYKWTKVETLLDNFAGLDPTIFWHDGYWWLTCGDDQLSHGWDKLFAWYAEEPKGPWTPHNKNPVKTDICSSRPAGTPFVHDDHLFRPAQDCSKTYGGRVVLQRILRLTRSEFQEEAVSTVDPSPQGPYPDGLHTLSAVDGITLIDGKRFQRAVSFMLTQKVHELFQRKSSSSEDY